jgi:tetratricopeptide (TPR) repeat protein
LTPLQRVLLAARALWFYPGKLVWPANLAFSYPHWDINPSHPLQYVPLLGWAVVAAALWFWRKKIGCGVIAGVVFFAAALSPLLGFITNYTFRYSYVADHYQYTAAIGLIAVIAAGIVRWPAKAGLPPSVSRCFSCALLLTLGWLTWQQCGAYRNLETLWRDTLSKNPESWMAHYNLAMELMDQGRTVEAEEHFRDTIAINPNHTKARNNLAILLASRGDYEDAVTQLKQALQIEPGSLDMWMNLGNFLNAGGKPYEAIECYRQAAARFPTEAEPLRRLAALLSKTGQSARAITIYQQALRLAPDDANLLMKLGNAYANQTNYDAAAESYRQALQREPANAGLHYNLGIMYGLRGQTESERLEMTEAVRLKPDFSEAMRQLFLLQLRRTN